MSANQETQREYLKALLEANVNQWSSNVVSEVVSDVDRLLRFCGLEAIIQLRELERSAQSARSTEEYERASSQFNLTATQIANAHTNREVRISFFVNENE